MKKNLILFVIALFAISCNDYGDQTYMKTIELKVNSKDWIENMDSNGLNRYYSSTFKLPELTSYIYSNGSVNTYISYSSYQQILPVVKHYQNSEGVLWTRTIDYDYAIGDMKIYVTNSDFFQELPETMTFRVVLMWQ